MKRTDWEEDPFREFDRWQEAMFYQAVMRMPNLGIVMAESRFRVRGVILEHDAGRRDRAVHFSIVFVFDRSKPRFLKRLDLADRSSGRDEWVVQGFLSRFVH